MRVIDGSHSTTRVWRRPSDIGFVCRSIALFRLLIRGQPVQLLHGRLTENRWVMFSRKNRRTTLEEMREFLWPTMGWRRTFKYIWRRLSRLSASPHAIALGVACGVFASFTPFMGLHLVIAFGAAYWLGGNLIAAALGTIVGNPLTFPLIWLAGYQVGSLLLGGIEPVDLPTVGYADAALASQAAGFWPAFARTTIGGVSLGLLAALMCYFPVRALVIEWQDTRRRRLARKLKLRAGAHQPI